MEKLNMNQRSILSIAAICGLVWLLNLTNNVLMYLSLTAGNSLPLDHLGYLTLNFTVSVLILIIACVVMFWRVYKHVIQPTREFALQVAKLNIESDHFEKTRVKNSPELKGISLKINQSMEALYKQRRFTELLMTSIEEAIITLCVDGKINYINGFGLNLLTKTDDITDKKLSFLVSLNNRQQQPLDSHIEQVIASSKSASLREELRFNCNQNHTTMANCSIYPLLNSSGKHCDGAIVLIKPDLNPVTLV